MAVLSINQEFLNIQELYGEYYTFQVFGDFNVYKEQRAFDSYETLVSLVNDVDFITKRDLEADGLSDYYDELIYVAGLLTTIETYIDSSKLVNLFTKSFTYSGGVLSQITLLNISTNVTETKTLNYDVSGNLINITKS